MITDTDIEKMKRVFATKDDLKDLSKRFDDVDKRFNDVDKRFDTINKRINGLSERVQNLSDGLHQTTEELVELITTGFKLNEERFDALEGEVFKAN